VRLAAFFTKIILFWLVSPGVEFRLHPSNH
jgi:hypothetical protein